MSFTPGLQKIETQKDWNYEFEKIQGELDEVQARIFLGRFLRQNLGLTLYLLSGVEILPLQEFIIKSVLLKDNGIIVGGRGTSKCKSEDSLCITQDGIKQLKDVNIGDFIFSLKTKNRVLDKVYNSEDDGFYIETKHGFSSKVKLGHKFLVWDKENQITNYKNVEDITFDDYLIIRNDINYWPKQELDNDIFYYLGLIIGDGYIAYNTIAVTGNDLETKEFLINFYKKHNVHYHIKNNKNRNPLTWEIRVHEQAFIKYIESFGVIPGIKSPYKAFPLEVLKFSKKNVATFISGLFDTDGWCSLRDGRNHPMANCRIMFCSSSINLIQTLQKVLLNFGIYSTIKLCHPGGEYIIMGKKCSTQKAYNLAIGGYSNNKLFYDNINFKIKRKSQKLKNYLDNCLNLINNDPNKIPGLFDYLSKKYGKQIFRNNSLRIFDNISISKANKILKSDILDIKDKEKIKFIVDNGLYFQQVVKKEEIKVKTIDIQVENEECYWSDGFINHNSFTIAILSILYPLFYFKSKMCLISANFRGSRRILEEAEKIITSKKAKLLRQCYEGITNTRSIVTRAPDMYRIKIPDPANSEVFALPLTDGLRGTRASFVVVDEGLMITKEIQDSILRPFLTSKQNMQEEKEIRAVEDELVMGGLMTDADRVSFPKNKYYVFSSASYQFEYLFKSFNDMIENIVRPSNKESDPPTYFCMRFSYKALPENSIIDLTQIKTAAANGGENTDYFKREYEAMFTDSSDSYFNILKMHNCTHKAGNFPTTQIIGDKKSEYILAIDPSYSSSKNSDYFAMGVYLIDNDNKSITLVHQYGKAGGEIKHHFEYFAYLLTFFNIVFVTIDASGTEFISGFNESTVSKEKNLKIEFIDSDFDVQDPIEYQKQLKEAKKQYNVTGRKIGYAQKFTSLSIRTMNEFLQNQIQAERIWFASPTCVNETSFNRQNKIVLPYIFENNQDQVLSTADFLESLDRWISEVKSEVALIEVTATGQGTLRYDLPASLRNSQSDQKVRKDGYSCLLIGAYAAKIYFDIIFTEEVKQQSVFIPRFIA